MSAADHRHSNEECPDPSSARTREGKSDRGEASNSERGLHVVGATVAVDIEVFETWPKDFYNLAVANEELLVNYHLETRRIDRLCEDDVFLRVNPPLNPYLNQYNSLVAHLDRTLREHSIVGYHCTRFTEQEIRDVTTSGLKTLSASLPQHRLRKAYNQGFLTLEQYEYIAHSPQLQINMADKNGRRSGLIWFTPNRSALQNSSGVHRLFRSWGGEALYCGLECDPVVSEGLRSIGVPCLIKCQLPVPDIRQTHQSLAARFVSFFVREEVSYPEPLFRFDVSLNRDVLASEVVEILQVGNPAFEELTQYRSWGESHKILS